MIRTALFTLLIAPFVLTSCQSNISSEPGFRKQPSGKDLSGWCYLKPETQKFDGQRHSTDKRFSANDGKLVVNPGKGIQKIWTQEEFGSDFILKLEFRAVENADSGIYLRETKAQLQCRDYLVAGPYKELKKYKKDELNIMKSIKKSIDDKNILNPGKIIDY